MSSYTRQQLEKWVKGIQVSGRILDVGGSQKPVASRVGIKGDAVFEIMDLETPHEGNKPSIVHDINMRYDFPVEQELYDVVFCLEVMEYVWNPVQALQNINRLLKKDGALFISTPFIYPVHNPMEQDYLRYTLFGITKLLKETGFKVVDWESRGMVSPGVWEAFVSTEGMKPSKQYDGHDSVGHLITATKI